MVTVRIYEISVVRTVIGGWIPVETVRLFLSGPSEQNAKCPGEPDRIRKESRKLIKEVKDPGRLAPAADSHNCSPNPSQPCSWYTWRFLDTREVIRPPGRRSTMHIKTNGTCKYRAACPNGYRYLTRNKRHSSAGFTPKWFPASEIHKE